MGGAPPPWVGAPHPPTGGDPRPYDTCGQMSVLLQGVLEFGESRHLVIKRGAGRRDARSRVLFFRKEKALTALHGTEYNVAYVALQALTIRPRGPTVL